MREAPKFRPVEAKPFSRVLRKEVRMYFKENNITTTANTKMVVRTIGLLVTFGILYASLYVLELPKYANFILWALLGITNALVCVNIGHDVIHGAYTKKKWLTKLLSHTFNLNGASAYMWKKMHNEAHHSFTNVHGHDEDISPVPVLRLCPSEPRKKIHRFQHIYAFFFYSLGTLSWVLMKDYVKFFSNKISNYKNEPHPTKEYFLLFLYKFMHYTIFLVLPLIFFPQAAGLTILGFVVMHLFSGFFLAVTFMMAHAVEPVEFPTVDNENIIKNDWAAHQLMTTANFAVTSKFATFMTGGLNQQIEHHLFPDISSIHYPAISKIVQRLAKEYNLPYYNLGTFGQAFKSHISFMKKMGKVD